MNEYGSSAVSSRIAGAMARIAVEGGLADDLSGAEIDKRIGSRRWSPTYPTVVHEP